MVLQKVVVCSIPVSAVDVVIEAVQKASLCWQADRPLQCAWLDFCLE